MQQQQQLAQFNPNQHPRLGPEANALILAGGHKSLKQPHHRHQHCINNPTSYHAQSHSFNQKPDYQNSGSKRPVISSDNARYHFTSGDKTPSGILKSAGGKETMAAYDMSQGDQARRLDQASKSATNQSRASSGSNIDREMLRQAWQNHIMNQNQSRAVHNGNNSSGSAGVAHQIVPYGSSRTDINQQIAQEYSRRFPSYLNTTGVTPHIFPNMSYRSSANIPTSNKSHSVPYWSNYPSSVTATGANVASVNWTGSKYSATPVPPPPSVETPSHFVMGHASAPVLESMKGDSTILNSHTSSARPHTAVNGPYVTQSNVNEPMADGDFDVHGFQEVRGASSIKTMGTSPMLYANFSQAHQGNSQLYQEWVHMQQKEIRRILRGEISQIKEMIENFGERLDNIQLIIKNSVEVSKTQDMETSTTSSSMTVTKKLSKGTKKRNVDHSKPSGKLISKELIRSLSGISNSNEVPQSNPSRSHSFGAPRIKVPVKHHATSTKTSNSLEHELSVEVIKEDDTRKVRTQKTSFKETGKNLVDVAATASGNSFEYARPRNNSGSIALQYPSMEQASSQPQNVDYHSSSSGQNRSSRQQKSSSDSTKLDNYDNNYSTPFHMPTSHVVNNARIVVQPVTKADRKLNYISPIASRPVSTESKLPLIPETDEMSIHCISSRESEPNNVGRQKESVEHETTTDVDESTLVNVGGSQEKIDQGRQPDDVEGGVIDVSRNLVSGAEVGMKSPDNSMDDVLANGDKLDERISCMRTEISELKQWIMMLQRNAEGSLEQGDTASTYLDDIYRKLNSGIYQSDGNQSQQ